ncbi:hypothetical protein BGZ97_008483, partial [Linnemannia gamsii]
MKIILALAAVVLSAPALVVGSCVDYNYGKGTFDKPSDCPMGYTIYSKMRCKGLSEHINDGGWMTGPGNWNVMSYMCDPKPIDKSCYKRNYGVGTYPKPCECKSGLTIYQNSDCSGAMEHLDGGWITRPGDWPVQSFRCDM